jgi:hypothetical protein
VLFGVASVAALEVFCRVFFLERPLNGRAGVFDAFRMCNGIVPGLRRKRDRASVVVRTKDTFFDNLGVRRSTWTQQEVKQQAVVVLGHRP